MKRRFNMASLGLAALLAAGAAAAAAETNAEDFVADFEDGSLKGWQFGKDQQAEITKIDGNSVLRIKGGKGAVVPLPVQPRQDFCVQFRIKDGAGGGVHFRNGYKVFFKSEYGDMWIRRPGAMLVCWVRGWDGRNYDLTRFHEIKVFCVGPIIRVYVDGKVELEMLDHSPVAKPIYLQIGQACFDDIRVTSRIPPEEGLIALPQDEDKDFWEEPYYNSEVKGGNTTGPRVKDRALVFPASAPVRLDIQVLNESAIPATADIGLTVDRFEEKLVNGPFSKSQELAAHSKKNMLFDLGTMAPGFYRVNIKLSRGGHAIRTTDYPLFIDELAGPVPYVKPAIPVGVFLATIDWKPLHTMTYWYAIADSLRRHNLNTAIEAGCLREFREIFQRYGISSLARTPDVLDHPAVLGLLTPLGNPDVILRLQENTELPVFTYVPAEDVGTGRDSDPCKVWEKLQPKARMLRIHPFKQGGYDLLKCPTGQPLPADSLKIAQSKFTTPLWVILQAISDETPGGEYSNPTPAQIRGETHLALAYGAKGIMYYAFQRHAANLGLVDHISLKPLDEKLQTVAEMADLIKKHGALLASLKSDSTKVLCDNPAVEALPVRNDTGQYIYVVNKNTQEQVTGRLTWPPATKLTSAQDVFTGKTLPIITDQNLPALPLTLAPGDGQLLLLLAK